jgi:hypothetical protein
MPILTGTTVFIEGSGHNTPISLYSFFLHTLALAAWEDVTRRRTATTATTATTSTTSYPAQL